MALGSWPADYGSPAGDDALIDTTTVVDTDLEVGGAAWRPLTAECPPANNVWFIDGVRRMEARIWLTVDDGTTLPGLAASWAAGAVRCDGAAVITDCRVERGLFSNADDRLGLVTDVGVFAGCHAQSSADAGLRNALQAAMRGTEHDIAREAGRSGELVLTDGPLRVRVHGRMVGYIKTQHVAYLSPALQATVERLAVGQRTPLFLTASQSWKHYSWYLRLQDGGSHPWEAMVRCETLADGVDVADAARLADEVAVTLPRFASHAHRDARAPQNLYPIGALERHLRHRLGDATVINRHLRRAVAAAGVSG